MSRIAQTIARDINHLMSNLKMDGVVECKVPVRDYPTDKVLELLELVNSDSKRSGYELRIHIAKQAIDAFSSQTISKISIYHSEWLDDKGNLTYYRNALAADVGKSHGNILQILVGCDCIPDQASIEHLRDYGSKSLWANIMNQSFYSWVREIPYGSILDPDKEYDECCRLLQVVMKYTDLNVIDDYLEHIEDNGRSLSSEIAFNLDSIGLCRLVKTSSVASNGKRNVNLVFKQIENLLNVRSDNTAAKIAVVDKLIEDVSNPNIDWRNDKRTRFLADRNHQGILGDYDSDNPIEYLEAVKDVLMNGRNSRHASRIRSCDGFTLICDVLGYKGERVSRIKGDIEVFGMPLEAVCQALWESMTNFMLEADGDTVVEKVGIYPTRFDHSMPTKKIDAAQLGLSESDVLFSLFVEPSFSGLDEYISSNVWDIFDSEDEQTVFGRVFGSSELDMKLGARASYSDSGIFQQKLSQLPCLYFNVVIACSDSSCDKIYKFKWKQQVDEPTVYSMRLVQNIEKSIDRMAENELLPVFFLPPAPYRELFLKDDSSVIDFFNQEIKSIDVHWISVPRNRFVDDDEYYSLIKQASESFEEFISVYAGSSRDGGGLYTILGSKEELRFVKSYEALFNKTDKARYEKNAALIAEIYKSFWLLDETEILPENREAKGFGSGIVTILHPVLVELVSCQSQFFCTQFCVNIKKVINSGFPNGEKGKAGLWERMMDFARLSSPISCVMPENGLLSTAWRGDGLFFRIGSSPLPKDNNIPMSTMMKYREDEENSIPDNAFTRVSEESRLIWRLIRDYYSTYSFAYDCLKISVVLPSDVQPVFCALLLQIRALVKNFDKDDACKKQFLRYPMQIQLTFYFDGESEFRLGPWISKFNEYFNALKAKDDKYSMVDLSIGYKSFASGFLSNFSLSDDNNEQSFESDIILLYETENTKARRSTLFYELPKFDVSSCSVKFPMLEKNLPRQRAVANELRVKRCSLISNRQFALNSAFMRYSRMISGNFDIDADTRDVIVKEEINLDEWQKILDVCLDHAERVLVIGPDIDKDIVKGGADSVVIVGFGSGIGSNANLNYAVASKIVKPDTLKHKLAKKYDSHFQINDLGTTERIMDNLYEASNQMADLSLVRTIGGLDYYMNDFFGYSMIRHLLKPASNPSCPVFCDVVISIDSYRHWIGVDIEDNMRADLIWLLAELDSDCMKFKLKLSVIESKVGLNIIGSNYLDKAKMQVDKTLAELVPKFMPTKEYGSFTVRTASGRVEDRDEFIARLGLDGKPQYDSRYWWMQLYRIIASNSTCADYKDICLIQAFENLAEGKFDIEWSQAIMSFDINTINAGVKVFDLPSDSSNNDRPCPLGPDWITKAYVFSKVEMIRLMLRDVSTSWEELAGDLEQRNGIDDGYVVRYRKAEALIREDDNQYRMMRDGAESGNWDLNSEIDYSVADDAEPDDLTFVLLAKDSEADGMADIDETMHDESGPYNQHDFIEQTDVVSSNGLSEQYLHPADVEMADDGCHSSDAPTHVNSDVDELGVEDEEDDVAGCVCSSNPNLPNAKILIGKEKHTERPIYWYYGTKYRLSNRHIFIVGSSGCGKSYSLQTLLAELARLGECCLIIDYTDGFTGEYIEPRFAKFVNGDNEVYVRDEKLAINPFKRQVVSIKTASGKTRSSIMSISEVAEKVTSIFAREYKQLGQRQLAALRNTIEEGLEECGDAFSLRDLGNRLKTKIHDKTPEAKVCGGLYDALGTICRLNPFSSDESSADGWMKYFTPNADGETVSIIQLANIDSKDAQKAIIEFILWDLWYYMNPSRSNKNTPRMIVLDEIQNMSFDDESPVQKYMKEGRKHGLSLIAATQSFAGISAKTFLDCLGNAATKMFFKPTDTDLPSISKMLSNIDNRYSDKEWASRLSNLGVGECVVVTSDEVGRVHTSLVKVSSFEERGF